MNIIPAIDLRNGSCVRLYQGDFDQQTEYSSEPCRIAQKYESLGFNQLHVVDLDGARSGEQVHQDVVAKIAAETSFSIQLGGGIRNEETLAGWLAAGVDRCVIGSLAVNNPDAVKQWINSFGADKIVLALDVRIDNSGTPRLATEGWTATSATTLWQCVDDFCQVQVLHVLCTDVSRDGALGGPNLDLYAEFIRRYPSIRLQASGGVRGISDLDALRELGASAAITGRALLDGRMTSQEIESFLRNA